MRPMINNNTYFTHLPTSQVRANPFNPRKIFDRDSLDELAISLSAHGMLQPIIVYKDRSAFVLICGERRLKAAKRAGLPQIPAIVHPTAPPNPNMLSMMLIENLQRKEVDVVNESTAIRLLIEEHNWSLAKVSRSLGAGAGFVRKRYLLTKFSDVLTAFTNESISYSEAIELASIDDEEARKWFFRRIEAGELDDIKKLSSAVARDKQIRSLLQQGNLLQRPLNRSAVEFDVEGLPYCDSNCPHYFRVSWDEKHQYKIPHNKPGWAEFCIDKCGDCFRKKIEAKSHRLAAVRSLKAQRPISDSGAFSMMWLTHEGRSCRNCRWMVETSALEEAGVAAPAGAHAVCSCRSPACYDHRLQALNERTARADLKQRKIDDRKRRMLLKELKTPVNRAIAPRPQLTKRECAFILLQNIAYLGGSTRLRDFCERHGWIENFPAQINAQVRYLRNKLVDELTEYELQDAMLTEACLAAAYSPEPFPPLKFRRDVQSEILVELKESLE